MSTHVALSANLLVNRNPQRVRKALTKHLRDRPTVAAFQESGSYVPVIDRVGNVFGYRDPIVAPKDAGRGFNSSVLIVRDDVPVYASGVMLVRAPWIGPKAGIKWPGRGFPWAVCDIEGKRTLVVSVHMPTGRLRMNGYAWRACLKRLRRKSMKVADRLGVTAVLLMGDWNCPAADDDHWSVRAWAKRWGASLVRTGTPIDYAVVRGLSLSGEDGPARGSDHRSAWFRPRR